MRLTHKLVAILLLPAFFVSSPAFARQSRVVDTAALTQAIARHAASERAQRHQIQQVLDRDDVRQLATTLGLSLGQASAAVATLGGPELAAASERASAVETALAGGANTIVISTTTLLLILIIVILVAQ
jgi:xanthine dehydrogenase iron-sulfur cluster and FAD-binding subunit A